VVATTLDDPAQEPAPAHAPASDAKERAPFPDPSEALDPKTFVPELAAAAGQGPVAFERWLFGHPELYSVERKAQLARPLMLSLASLDPPLSPSALAIVLHFFGLDSPDHFDGALADAIAGAQRRAAMPARGTLSDERASSRAASPSTDVVLRELTTQPNRWRRIAILMVPSHRTRMRRLLARIDIGGLPPSTLDPGAVAYWRKALRPGRAWFRWLAGVLLAIALAAGIYSVSAVDSRILPIAAAIVVAGFVAWRFRARLPVIEMRISWRWIWVLVVLARLAYRLRSH
jgi:hypothetical protein